MQIKWILLFTFLFSLFSFQIFGQNENPYRDTDDIWDDFNPTGYADTTCWYESDFIYLASGDSLYLIVPLWRSQGAMWFHGYITAIDSLKFGDYSEYSGERDTVVFEGTDSVYFGLAPHTGSKSAFETNEAETYTLLDSAQVTSANGTAAFSFFPMATSAFRNYACRHWSLLIYNQSGSFSKIKLKIEWIDTFKK